MKDNPMWLIVHFERDGEGWRTELASDDVAMSGGVPPTNSYEELRREAKLNGRRMRFDQRTWDAMVDAGMAPIEAPDDVEYFVGGETTDQIRLNSALVGAADRFRDSSAGASESAHAAARYAWRLSDDDAAACLYTLDEGTNLLSQPWEFEGQSPQQVIEKLLASAKT